MNLPNRRETEHYDFGPFTMSLGILPGGSICEVFFSNRGKIGHQLDDYLRVMGIAISKRIQGETITDEEMATW